MPATKYNFSILFTSLDEYKKHSDYEEISDAINSAREISEYQDLRDFINHENLLEDAITFTKS